MKNFVKILEKIVEDCKEIFSLSLVKKMLDSRQHEKGETDPHQTVLDPPNCVVPYRY